MPHGIKGWGVFLVAQAALTFAWHMLEKLAEHAMLTWSDDQIAKFIGLSSPEASTVISWAIPAFFGFVTLLAYHTVQSRISSHKIHAGPSHGVLALAMAENPFTSQWPLAQAVIDYVAVTLGVSQHEACLALQRRLLDGSVRARGPINSTSVAEVDGEFWRFALPDSEGRANNLSTFDYLPWFEVCAKDVLAIWPANRKAAK